MKVVRSATVGTSLDTFCRGLLSELQLQDGYEVLAVTSPDDALQRVGEREGVRTLGVPMERHISPLKDLVSLWRLYRVFRKERPDMVHSMTPKAGLLCMLAAWMARVPLRVHTFTGLVFPTASGLKQKLLIATDRLTCSCATHIIPEGNGVKRDLENFKITSKPLKVLGNGNVRGIDPEYYNRHNVEVVEASASLRRQDKFTFIFIGRLVGDKGINELVEAFKRLNRDYPDTRLVLVGGHEPNLDPLKEETLTDIATIIDIVAVGRQEDVRPWLAASDALVFPSYREGFPNVVIEAGAMGLPSIVTDINGSNEIIVDGKNGLIVPPLDSDALYSAMVRILTDGDLYAHLASNARPMIVSRYEQGFVRKCLKDFYKDIIDEKAS